MYSVHIHGMLLVSIRMASPFTFPTNNRKCLNGFILIIAMSSYHSHLKLISESVISIKCILRY